MTLFSSAHAAAGAGAPSGGGIEQLILPVIILVIFYFLLIRPQNKRRKEHQELMGSLSNGDEVVTAGGIVGKVSKVEDDFVVLEVSKGMDLRFQKSAVGATLPKGTLKSLDSA